MRRIHHQRPRARRQRRRQRIEIRPKRPRPQTHPHRPRPRQLDRRQITVIARLQHHHLIARPRTRHDRHQQRLRRPGRHRHLLLPVISAAIHIPPLRRNRLPQNRRPRHRRILVMPRPHRQRHLLHQRRIAIKIRKTLPQIHRPMPRRQRRHLRKNIHPQPRQTPRQTTRQTHCCFHENQTPKNQTPPKRSATNIKRQLYLKTPQHLQDPHPSKPAPPRQAHHIQKQNFAEKTCKPPTAPVNTAKTAINSEVFCG